MSMKPESLLGDPAVKSKFNSVLDAHKRREPGPEPTPAPEPPPPPAPAEPPRRGHPPGKRSDSAYTQVTAYILEDLHHGVKMALLKERKGREFSQLVASLLSEWVASQTSPPPAG
jgi:hypothetical protein